MREQQEVGTVTEARRSVDGGVAPRRIGSISVEVATRHQALVWLLAAVGTARPSMWAFCNAHTANMARARPDFRAALARATVFNDGLGMDLASRMLYGAPFPDNLNGTDLTPALLAALPTSTPVFLLGAQAKVAERAASVITERYPNARVVGWEHGFFAPADEPALAARIRDTGARLVLVAMGHPRQELWAARHLVAINAALMCVGAYLDFVAGAVNRAPAMVRAARMEWAYRLMLEPRRLAGRYLLGNGLFMAATLRERLLVGRSG